MSFRPIFRNTKQPAIIAHRGASAVHHENTIDAFAAAVTMGADGIELDVRRSRDGVLLVHHDPRVRGQDAVIADMTWPQVRDAAGTLGYEIPTLAEAVQFCAGRIALDVELKETGYEAAVVAEVNRSFGPDHVVYTSFHDVSISAVKQYAPSYRAGLLLGHNLFSPKRRTTGSYLPIRRLLRSRADFVAPHWQLLRFGFLRRLHRIGCPIAVWTVNRTRQAQRLVERGVNVIITDHPDRMLKALRR